MATPALRALRERLPGAYIAALVRPNVLPLVEGLPFLDDVRIDQHAGVMSHKNTAKRLRADRFDTALLLSNSFSTALITRLAWIPRRIGYARDARALMLTRRLEPPRRKDVEPFARSGASPTDWAPIPACDYYMNAVRALLDDPSITPASLELALTDAQRSAANHALHVAGFDAIPFAVLIPGGNDPAKRWPAERYAALAEHLIQSRNLGVLVSGSPAERDLIEPLCAQIRDDLPPERTHLVAAATDLELSLGALKGVLAHARLVVTNDTGPRHIAAAFGAPLVTLFGPTDHRWTTIPFDREAILLADPALPEQEVANDHPDRCRIDRIPLEKVIAAAEALLDDQPVPTDAPPARA